MRSNFLKELEKYNTHQKNGKIIVISGISGSGKSLIANLLVSKHNFALINKYTTRPFRPPEIRDNMSGKQVGLKAVCGNYNHGDLSEEEQKNLSSSRKSAFLRLRLPLTYVNYDNYYGFSINEIDNYITNGRNVVVIVNDIGVVEDLKNIYKESCLSCYVHRADPKNKDMFMKMAESRELNPETGISRWKAALDTSKTAINNITLYDRIILNTENGTAGIEHLLNSLVSEGFNKFKDKNIKHTTPKIYAFIGTPGSGKDAALEIVKVQGILHSIIMPKHTTRKRKTDDGEEIICSGDKNFDMNSCDLQYYNFGATYGINTNELRQRLNDDISSSIIVSNPKALKRLKEIFPQELVTIYIHGLSKEEYTHQNADKLDDEYVKRHIEDYNNAAKLYFSDFLKFNHVILNNGNLSDLKIQIDAIMRFYEQGRDFSISNIKNYISKANKYISKFARETNRQSQK